jgi:hypothetical protein
MAFYNRQVKVPIKPQVTFNKIKLEYTTSKIFGYAHYRIIKMEFADTNISKQTE